ncbi:serine/threonine-protein kinase [Phenylobacterium sp.]|jgi:serine/threonine protein kinase|uniref:serine/threonine-protein kinase n=1 Tax=Phenylobacterium sp. TaxID=1871053 RepID=UPI002F3E5F28
MARTLRPPPHIIGVGGFGVTYRVVDDHGAAFAMKEYFPRDHAVRGADGRIAAKRSEDGFSRKIYEEGLRRFVAEGHMLTSFVHPNVQRVVDTFDDNGTSYQLMKLVEGREALGESDTGAARIERRVTLDDYFRELERPDGGVPIDLPLLEPVLRQLLDAVEYIHTEGARKAQEITGASTRGLLHRDIKPSNVLIDAPAALIDAPAAEILRHPETRAILIDFGSARLFRDAETDDVSRSIGVVTEGYAPPEFKDNQIEQQGPHSDIYSLAAIVWRAFLGRKPNTAQLANGAKLADLAQPVRGADGVLRPRAPKAFLQSVDRALNAAVGARPQSVAEWRRELWSGKPPARERGKPAKKPAAEERRGLHPVVWLIGLLMTGASLFAWFNSRGPERNIEAQADLAYQDAQKAAALAGPEADHAAEIAKGAADTGRSAVDPSEQGGRNYADFQAFVPVERITHSATSGDTQYGDKYRNFRLSDGQNANWWCHKKGPDIVPDAAYDTYKYPSATVDGEAGWACAIGHTHLVQREYTGSRNPWKMVGSGYTYAGEVDTAEKPSGLGVMTFPDNHELGGRFAATANGFEATGVYVATLDLVRTGVFEISAGAGLPSFDSSSTEDQQKGKVIFRGRTTKDRTVGLFVKDGVSTTGVRNNNGVIVGRSILSDGSVFYGLTASPDPAGGAGAIDATAANVTKAWGRLEGGEGIYTGQLTGGKPDGCGIWDRHGQREVGYYDAGVKRQGGLPDECRSARYAGGFDLSALPAAPGAAAAK